MIDLDCWIKSGDDKGKRTTIEKRIFINHSEQNATQEKSNAYLNTMDLVPKNSTFSLLPS